MTAHALVTGTLFRAPESRTSKNGKNFVSATIKAREGEGFRFWRLIVFSESAAAELVGLGEGDAVSAAGALKIETYEKDGVAKIVTTIIADKILALTPKRRERQKPENNRSPAPADRRDLNAHAGSGADYFHDEMPF